MKIIAMTLLLLITIENAKPQNQEVDYLKELKEQLSLKWPDNKTINIVFHGHSVPSGYFNFDEPG